MMRTSTLGEDSNLQSTSLQPALFQTPTRFNEAPTSRAPTLSSSPGSDLVFMRLQPLGSQLTTSIIQ